MVARAEIHWADLGDPWGRRPVCVVTRDAAIPVLRSVTAAPLTRTVRGIASEVLVGENEGLHESSVIACDSLITIPVDLLDPEPAGMLSGMGVVDLDQALRYALGIRY